LKEPTPTPGIPLPPAWLEGEALENYHRLGKNVKEMGVVSVNDGDALALTAAALVEYIVTQKKVKREGTVIQRETKFGRTTIANPNVAIRNDAWRRASDGLSKFGLDPR
jgi:P27 family predicted phage terminase small subunit